MFLLHALRLRRQGTFTSDMPRVPTVVLFACSSAEHGGSRSFDQTTDHKSLLGESLIVYHPIIERLAERGVQVRSELSLIALGGCL